ncbi:MAG: hypothetical protein MPJ50_16540 [Pirellulales bacterium]|nr:hypothetical protein [Pirellulales bacterium]
MGRKRKGPWWHKNRQYYVTTRPRSKEIVKLDTATRLYHELMADWADNASHQSNHLWTVAI